MRLIDADILLSEANDTLNDCVKFGNFGQAILVQGFINSINKSPTIEERPHGGWIPVKERLPEEDGKYIVCWCGDWGASICFAEYSKCGKYWYERNGSEYRGITAWMPLPKPYKRGDDV